MLCMLCSVLSVMLCYFCDVILSSSWSGIYVMVDLLCDLCYVSYLCYAILATHGMLCYFESCYLCYVMLHMLPYVISVSSYYGIAVMLCYQCYAMLFMLWYVCYVMFRFAIYVMFCYAVLSRLCYVISEMWCYLCYVM